MGWLSQTLARSISQFAVQRNSYHVNIHFGMSQSTTTAVTRDNTLLHLHWRHFSDQILCPVWIHLIENTPLQSIRLKGQREGHEFTCYNPHLLELVHEANISVVIRSPYLGKQYNRKLQSPTFLPPNSFIARCLPVRCESLALKTKSMLYMTELVVPAALAA